MKSRGCTHNVNSMLRYAFVVFFFFFTSIDHPPQASGSLPVVLHPQGFPSFICSPTSRSQGRSNLPGAWPCSSRGSTCVVGNKSHHEGCQAWCSGKESRVLDHCVFGVQGQQPGLFTSTWWKEKEKQRHYFANKGLSSQDSGFSNSHVWMSELGYK